MIPEGTCFSYGSNNILYTFPSLNCTNGSYIPSFNTTERKTYNSRNGKLYLTRIETVSYNSVSSYIVYNFDSVSYNALDINYLILPCTLIVLALFAVIYRWFFRLRA